jgi:hypothetical protein
MPRKFDFVSPGVQITEVDQSQIETPLEDDGLLVIGRAKTGPAGKPVRVTSLQNFIDVFGKPISGKGSINDDVWRDGNNQGPTYASYAAQAWLASETSPLTFVRLLGEDSPNQAGGYVAAGWDLGGNAFSGTPDANGTAYGLFIVPSASVASTQAGTLAAVFYTTGSALTLSGTVAGSSATTSSAGCLVQSISTATKGATFKLEVHTGNAPNTYAPSESLTFHFDPDEKTNYIRNIVNTNPQKLYSKNFAASQAKKYFLGETYEEAVSRLVTSVSSSAGHQYGILLPLMSGSDASNNLMYHKAPARESKTGWIINRDPAPQTDVAAFSADLQKKLFRLCALSEGSWFERNYYVAIEDLSLGTPQNPNSTFSVNIRNLANNVVESFSNLNLDETSEDFIGKRIGDMYQQWDGNKERYEMYGEYPNQSNYVRVEMADDWKATIDDTYKIPWGFFGPAQPKDFSIAYGSSGPQVSGDGVNDGTPSNATITINAGNITNGATITFTSFEGISYIMDFDTSVALGSSSGSFDSNNRAKVGLDSVIASASGSVAARMVTILSTFPVNGSGFQPTTLDDDGAGSGGAGSGVCIIGVSASVNGPALFSMGESGDSGNNISLGAVNAGTDTDNALDAYVRGNGLMPYAGGDSTVFARLPTDYTASFSFPRLKLTEENTSRASSNYEAKDLFGLNHKFAAKNVRGPLNDRSFIDLLRYQGGGIDLHTTNAATQHSFVFSLDEVRKSNGKYYWASGSHATGDAETAGSGSQQLLTNGVKRFALPMFGGFDGLDITQVSPFSSKNVLDESGNNDTTHYANYSIKKAIQAVSDSEVVAYDVISIPGLTNTALSNELISAVEDRADALAIIDLDDQYKETFEGEGSRSGGGIDDVKTTARTRDLNTSYAATYYPRVRMRDTLSGNGDVFIAPSSVAALGALAFSDANSEGPWFAPAGFNRGGISILGGNEGPRVTGTWKNLPKSDRDELYELNINPVARFPAVGEVVIFGQKTLQQTASALDRINVRRLMVFLKKRIGAIADTILFDQNVQATWSRFKSSADLILSDVQARFGITEYKLVLDTTTTTPDLIDQNILYAKIFVKPARAIEFIAIDFVITRSGVQF